MSITNFSINDTVDRRLEQAKKQFWYLLQDQLAASGLVILAGFFFLGIFGPMLAPHSPFNYQVTNAQGEILRLSSPSVAAPLGTTSFGQDILSQFLVGARPTFIVGLLGGVGTSVLGFLVGLTSGYFGGYVDEVLMRFTDLTYSLPLLPMALLILTFVEPNILIITLIIMLFLWKIPARVVRSEVLSVKQRTFVKSARASGASDLRTMFVHVAPNVLSIGVLYTAYGIAWSIAVQASLAFLGFGDPTTTSWGQMLRAVFTSGAIRTAWWWVLPPALGIASVTTAVFLVGRAYEEITNPEIRNQ
ncbi:peptide/nickel transport system permease protein [Halogranum gelatinilyticum]|uniref:Peptide/nickel transport system permease protein n=1 Tax=Halogranum gelatinilyticum TaxID=660521 RepID=A0A1G9YZJ2_9EURY|nr:ABC transporter permease [Halogranum gelatinilyticum]SDN14347.1 peptide/nickel transport system permease protein [Halogranum gelatinilyticum]